MTSSRSLLPGLLLWCSLYLSHIPVLHAQTLPVEHPYSTSPSPPHCPSPIGFANTLVRAPVPGSPTLQLKDSFLFSHILFIVTDLNTALPQSAFASFCLDQCIAHLPDPNATTTTSGGGKGPCLSFTVDMGKPVGGAPTNGNATATRWWCEGFDAYLNEDLSDYVEAEVPGSYMYGLSVNRACGGTYRAF